MGEVAERDYPFVREVVDRAEANRRFADDPLKLERISELRDDETITVYTDGPFTGSLPRSARPAHRPAQALQAALLGRRLLARRRAAADAAADLRHRLVQEGRARRLPAPAGGGAQARPPARWAASSTCSCSIRSRPARRSGPTAARRWCNVLNDYVRELTSAAGYQEIKTPLLYNKGLWEISGHWGKYRENMFLVLDNETGEHDFSLKPMNCPSHYLLYSAEEALAIASCRCGYVDLRRAAPERGVRRAVADSRECGSSSRTTATSSSWRARSPTK